MNGEGLGRIRATAAGLILLALTTGGACAAVSAAETGTEIVAPEAASAPLSPEARGVDQIVTAAQVAAWGRERRDAGALIMAARILREVPVRAAPDGGDALITTDSLLDEAEGFAAGHQGVLEAIARLRGTRGVQNSPFGRGPIFTVKEIRARETYWFEIDARGGEVLRIAAIGDGDTNIDMAIRDARGVIVCEDGFGDHYPVCTVAPAQSGKMRIDITNRGDVWTKVQILSN